MVAKTSAAARNQQPPGRAGRLRDDPRLRHPGWVLLPLRAFLGVTFVYAGLSKLLDPNYLDASSPVGVRAQMLHAAAGSPIGALVRLSAEHATATGLLIAFGELAVGLGVLLGLYTRVAAAGGAALAASFYLTVSWQTSPYFYGPDIVFLFAWTPLVLAGDAGLFTVGNYLRERAWRQVGNTKRSRAALAAEVERRVVLHTGAVAGAVGAVALLGGGILAATRRRGTPAATAGHSPGPAPTGAAAPSGAPSGAAGGIAAAASVPVGGSVSFTAPDGSPAYLLHPSQGTFRALSAVCTHQGCTVQYTGTGFSCPCHGATYDLTGQVTSPPAEAPLAPIPVKVVDGEVTLG